MKIKALIWIFFGSCCITSAFASHDYEIDHEIDKPYYAGLGFGFSSSDSECDYYGWDCDGEGTSFTFMAGKRLHENFAIELAYLDLGNLDDEQSAGITTTAESTGFNLSVLGISPLEHHGYFFAKVGAMAWDTDYTRRDGNTRLPACSGLQVAPIWERAASVRGRTDERSDGSVSAASRPVGF